MKESVQKFCELSSLEMFSQNTNTGTQGFMTDDPYWKGHELKWVQGVIYLLSSTAQLLKTIQQAQKFCFVL